MSSFKVSIDTLTASAAEFLSIEASLKSAEQSLSLGGASACPELESAMEEFANDWDIERERLCWKAKDISLALTKAADTYSGCEKHLVSNINESRNG